MKELESVPVRGGRVTLVAAASKLFPLSTVRVSAEYRLETTDPYAVWPRGSCGFNKEQCVAIDEKSWKPAEVRCLSSHRADERPLAFCVDGRESKVRSVRSSWREPDYLWFRVEAEDGRVYDLRHHEYEDWWQARLASYRARKR